MTNEQLNEILESHKKWLNNEDGGVRAVLIDEDLSYACLIDSDLRSADLRGTDLSYADLRGTDLSYADLRGTDLSYACLIDSDLSYANLRGADLRDADLRCADLRGTNLYGADLRDSDLRFAIGNNKEVKSLQLGTYSITILIEIKIHIGCQAHTIEQWENFTDEEISEMGRGALDWWNEWKEVILKVAKGE